MLLTVVGRALFGAGVLGVEGELASATLEGHATLDTVQSQEHELTLDLDHLHEVWMDGDADDVTVSVIRIGSGADEFVACHSPCRTDGVLEHVGDVWFFFDSGRESVMVNLTTSGQRVLLVDATEGQCQRG